MTQNPFCPSVTTYFLLLLFVLSVGGTFGIIAFCSGGCVCQDASLFHIHCCFLCTLFSKITNLALLSNTLVSIFCVDCENQGVKSIVTRQYGTLIALTFHYFIPSCMYFYSQSIRK